MWGPSTVPLACMPCGGCVPRGWWGSVPGGGGLTLLWGVSGVRRCSSPGRPSSGADSWGSATRVSRVRSVRAWGPSTGPTACAPAGRRCSLWGWRKGIPGGGALHRCGGRLRSGAPPPPTARPLGGLSGSATDVLWARVCGCGGPALSPWLACPLGAACHGGGGGPSPGGVACPGCSGVSGVRRCPSPDRLYSGAGSRASATRVSWVRSLRAWGPSTGATACALAGWCCLPWGWRRGVPGGSAFHRCRGRLRSGAPPPPDRPLSGRAVGGGQPRAVCAVCRCGGPTLCPWLVRPVGAACCGGCGGLSPGGVAPHRCEGRLVSGAVPPPADRPLGRAVRVLRPVCPRCGRCGRGDPAPAPQRAPFRAGVARCGGGGRASPGGGAFRRCEGRLRSDAPPPPTARPLGGLSESATHVLWARSCRCGGPVLSPWLACPVRAACCRGGGGPSPGGVACHRCSGASGVRRCPSPGRLSSWAGSWGSGTCVSRVQSVQAWVVAETCDDLEDASRRSAVHGGSHGVGTLWVATG